MSDNKAGKDEGNPSGIGGVINLNDDVVATVAALAAKSIEGIASVGRTSRLALSDRPSRGVEVEVGETQAAFDLDIGVDYGYDIRQLAEKLRKKTAEEVMKMTGREVVELNVHVVDIKLPEEVEKTKKPRVV